MRTRPPAPRPMPVATASRTLAASPEVIWAVLADPHHQPRWWPRVRRVEGVREERFTQVLVSDRGRAVRADFRILEREAPHRVRWTQELPGTPFERLLAEAETVLVLAPCGAGETEVRAELRERLRGWSRLVPFLFRRAGTRQLTEALEALETVVVG
jgi:uncharacterized protein YndB with AHSA1/START domain